MSDFVSYTRIKYSFEGFGLGAVWMVRAISRDRFCRRMAMIWRACFGRSVKQFRVMYGTIHNAMFWTFLRSMLREGLITTLVSIYSAYSR